MGRSKGESVLGLFDDYVVVDIETTGLNPRLDSIIEIGALRVKNGEIVDKFNTLMRPAYFNQVNNKTSDDVDYVSWQGKTGYFIDGFIISLTGITNKMLLTAPEPKTAIDDFFSFINNDDIIIGHNVNFDINFLYDAYDKFFHKDFDNNFLDTMKLSKHALKSLQNHRLEDLSNYFNIDYRNAHRALEDCIITNQCYCKLKDYICTNNIALPSPNSRINSTNSMSDEISTNEISDSDSVHDIWETWSGIHELSDQKKRLATAKKSDFTIISLDQTQGTATFSGSYGVYETTLKSCDCMDFSRRGKPCKHMYKLALECDLLSDSVKTESVSGVTAEAPEPAEKIIIPPTVSVKQLSYIDFGKSTGDVERFLNYSFFRVKGKDSYKIKRTFSEQEAVSSSERDGLIPPYSVIKMWPTPATKEQLEYMKSSGITIPDEINEDVANDIIARINGDDSIEAPEPWLVELATGLGKKFTSYIGRDGLMRSVFVGSGLRTSSALYAYAVKQNINGLPLGNMLTDPDRIKFYKFANNVIADKSLSKSLRGRDIYDFLKPKKGTKIYKAALAFLINDSI